MNFRYDIGDADFVHLAGVMALSMWARRGISDAGFAHLRGIHTLYMRGCTGVADAGLAHLRSITLGMRGITNTGHAQLTGIAKWTRDDD